MQGPTDLGPSGTRSAPPERSLGVASGLVGLATLASRVLGLVREQLFAAFVGASAYSDAFIVGFRIPNLLRDLFAEGALSAAFVPTFADRLARRGRDDAFALASLVMSTLVVLLGVLVLLAMFFAEPLVAAIAPGFAAEKAELAILLARIMMPFLLLVSLAAVCMGMLNAQQRSGRAALAPALFNVVTIIAGVAIAGMQLSDRHVVIAWSVATLAGGLAQFLFQLWPLWKEGFRFRLRIDLLFRDEGLRRIGLLMGPAIVGLAATQTNIFVNTIFASHDERAATWLNYAFRVLYLPIGVLGVGAGAVTTARLARAAALGDVQSMSGSVTSAIRYLLLLCVPATVGLIVLARPVVRLLFERGRFGPDDTEATATVLALYGIGLVAYSSVKVLASSTYALSRPRIAVFGSFAAVATNLLFNLFLYRELGYRALAIGTSLGALVNCTVLIAFLQPRLGFLNRDILVLLAKVGVAAGAMGVAIHYLALALERSVGTSGLMAQLIVGIVPVGIGALLYGVVCHFLGIRGLAGFLRRRKTPTSGP